jgi:redox-sensitive bicupin YhaK (pirin superfamily)
MPQSTQATDPNTVRATSTPAGPRLTIRRASERGHAVHGWLDSFHTFSFADYQDPAHMGYRALRVINEDRVAPGQGFGRHPHQDMEILSYVLEGALEHKDSLGTGSIIRPGDVQRMSAGTGVTHSEFNASKTEGVHFLQIWIVPDRRGHAPGYEQKAFSVQERTGTLRLVASSDGRDGSLTIHQAARVYAGLLAAEAETTFRLEPGRHAWVHVARGAIDLNGVRLEAGDAAAVDSPGELKLAGRTAADVLVFDLA